MEKLGWNCLISGDPGDTTNTMECFDADLDNMEIRDGGFSAHLTTTPVTVTFLLPQFLCTTDLILP